MQAFVVVLLAGTRLFIISVFFLVTRIATVVKISDATQLAHRSPTYYALLHKRDNDPFYYLPVLYGRGGWRAWRGDLQFGLRGDAFAPGFLTRLLVQPRWLAHMLYPLDIGPVLRLLGAHPLSGWSIHPVENWLRLAQAQLGDRPAGTVLTPAFLRDLAERSRTPVERLARLPLGKLLTWRYQAYLQRNSGPEIFTDALRRSIERQAIARIKSELDDAAGVLQAGHTLLGAPEGRLSPEGRIGPPSAGFRRIMRAAPVSTRVVPLAIIYDFMTTGRARVFLSMAPPINRAPEMDIHELAARLASAWRAVTPLTCTQLGTGLLVRYLRDHKPQFTTAEFARDLGAAAREVAARGQPVDGILLDARRCRRRARRFLAYARRQGAVAALPGASWLTRPLDLSMTVAPGEVGYERYPFAYAWNELRDLAE